MTTMLTGRPGPVNMDVPFNLFQEEGDVTTEIAVRTASTQRRSGASPEDIAAAVEDAAGGAAAGAVHRPRRDAVRSRPRSSPRWRIASAFPVISSPNGMGCFDMTDPLSLGFIGRNGAYPANQAGRHCGSGARDRRALRRSLVLVVAAGLLVELPGRPSSSTSTSIRRARPQLPADARHPGRCAHFLRQLLAELDARSVPRTLAALEAWQTADRGWRAEWEATCGRISSIHHALRPGACGRPTAAVLPDDAILSLDSGVHHNWFMQFWRPARPQTMLNTWGFSAMGFGPSGVLGAKLAAPDRPCVSVCGDGGFTHGAACAVHRGRVRHPVRVGGVEQLRLGRDPRHPVRHVRRPRASARRSTRAPNGEPYNPDFAAWARACRRRRHHGRPSSEDFAGALEHAISSASPCLLDVHVDANVRPPRPAPGRCRRSRTRSRSSASRSCASRRRSRLGLRQQKS